MFVRIIPLVFSICIAVAFALLDRALPIAAFDPSARLVDENLSK
jgi:hypothetical protein